MKIVPQRGPISRVVSRIPIAIMVTELGDFARTRIHSTLSRFGPVSPVTPRTCSELDAASGRLRMCSFLFFLGPVNLNPLTCSYICTVEWIWWSASEYVARVLPGNHKVVLIINYEM